jgi:hypothetical protein
MQPEDFFSSWSLCFVGSTSLCSMLQGFLSPCKLLYLFGTSESIPCSRSYLVITTLWHPLSCSVSSTSFFVFYHGLEPKVPDCAGFQYLKLTFNPRSIPLNPCVNDLPLTHNGLPFKLVVVVVIELRQQRTFPSTSYGRCFIMESKRITTRVS